ncbi:MAG: hypothetical protein GXY83_30935 [Rhodopirellula sp.]|nr:hypothetical protein [Rhodopirellula sp.]
MVRGEHSVLAEVRLQNAGNESVRDFSPGFCLQLAGAYSPTTFAYTIIPRNSHPFPVSMGRYFTARPAMWANVGWVKADFTDSESYRQRQKQGEAFKPPSDRWIHEAGDFPLLARRLPGRDAWIAWIWPNATGYFGNTQSPCMHMDPILQECPPKQTRSLFGRLLFFEGSWEGLYALAERERRELTARSGLPCADTAGKKVKIVGIVLKWIRADSARTAGSSWRCSSATQTQAST